MTRPYSKACFSLMLAGIVMLPAGEIFAGTASRSADSSRSTASSQSGGSGRSGGSASSTRSSRGSAGNRSGTPTKVKGSSSRGRGGSFHRRGGHYRGRYSSYYRPYFGGYYYGRPGYYGGLFSYYGPYFGLSYYAGHSRYSEGYGSGYETGALDLNVKPKKTGVFLDGQYIGTAGSYDGYPRHLWVEEGLHEITFYLEGYRNETRRIRVQRGALIDLTFRMQPGEAVRPQEGEPQFNRRLDSNSDGERTDWSNDRYSRRNDDGGYPPVRQGTTDGGRSTSRDLRAEPGRLRMNVAPDDATVYVDGKFLGTGRELSDLRSGLILESGKHRLDVVRPGFDGETVDFLLDAGAELELEIELKSKGQGSEV